jgi:hypothetical protein
MTSGQTVSHEFVEYVPRELKDGVVYVSIPFATVIHKCCCGCGQQVVTPLAPSQWTLSFDGKSISLYPSIGNWKFPCKSHYWIKNDRVSWAREWNKGEIAAAQHRDASAIEDQFAVNRTGDEQDRAAPVLKPPQRREGRLTRLRKWLFGK